MRGSALVTFVIPTLGRPSLRRAIDSVVAQYDDGWRAIVVHDPRAPWGARDEHFRKHSERDGYTLAMGPRILLVAGRSRSAGELRNEGIARARTDWIAFLDDDDELDPMYVAHLRQHAMGFNPAPVFVSRMDHPTLGVLPDPIEPEIAWGKVGISYAVRRDVLWPDPFHAEDLSNPGELGNEDYRLLNDLRACGNRIAISDHVDYIVRPT